MQIVFIFSLLCGLSLPGAFVQAAGSQDAAGGSASAFVPINPDEEVLRAAALSGGEDLHQEGLADMVGAGADGEDEASLKIAQHISPDTEQNGTAAAASGRAESLRTGPPSPPPDIHDLQINDKVLLASNSVSATKSEDKDKAAPAPEPKTSKSSSVSTPLLVGAGVAIIAGAVAAAGGSSSDSDSGPTTPTPPSGDPGDTPSANSEVINLSSLVRIGDDTDYNGNHPDKFKQNRPSGTSWTDSFNISNANTVTSAKFKYTVAGSKVGNPVYINGKQAGRLCNPGNTAWNVESCSIGITGLIRSGSNEIKIKCGIDESDTDTPYDDVELYNLRIELTR